MQMGTIVGRCERCGNIIYNGKFCNISCANSRTWSEETNEKRRISNSIASIKLWQNPEFRYKIYNNRISRETQYETILKHILLAQSGWQLGDRFGGMYIIAAANYDLLAAVRVDNFEEYVPRDLKRRKEINQYCLDNNYFLFTISVSYLKENATDGIIKLINHLLIVNNRESDQSTGRIIELGNEYK